MRFRPCIDIHDGQVKQIVGSSLDDRSDSAKENFVSAHDAGYFASMYREKDLPGGHVIMLNARGTDEYEASKRQAMLALEAYPGGLMVGGGLNDENVGEFLDAGASHGIFTSFIFSDGQIQMDRLRRLVRSAGREHIVLDLSCKKRDGDYYVVTDRWQKFTDQKLSLDLLRYLEDSCDEYLIHAADVEGKKAGADEQLLSVLADYDGLPVTYAGGVGSYDDLREIKKLTDGRIDVTIGSALDIFGGTLELEQILSIIEKG
ncbi:MAG: phosphoribosylformimino-5-aminoimidazole carboxamide ribotide isomerase [Lachnospiraceae bacterium]|uniref:Phosphoribosylformimino-5-aminoimidazole carboxamide ribotide isomerase n=1 Tax=Candidatus Weimeria bifida TaxID=2599074 RepID=A0A6N7IYK0_9FIRM|nr:phosphoribosylformimino-5-aminoimidazole carboxamide ribotide isomerase [Candidatus Weimeria bifida]RRF96238.1 MAG: phosphoribosylformimino-5-aminoimidazole carboxamide ribotide isomerase [Lachnospiraceae bacterium]